MRRILAFVFSVFYTFVKFPIMKIWNWRGFSFHFVERFSPSVVTDFERSSRIEIGRRVKVRSGTKIQVRKGSNLKIGDGTKINYNCIIACHDKIEIGNKSN